jgi:hypothetical protein
MTGASQVYAVELTKPGGAATWPASKALGEPQ